VTDLSELVVVDGSQEFYELVLFGLGQLAALHHGGHHFVDCCWHFVPP
jgi:hypothetical protein